MEQLPGNWTGLKKLACSTEDLRPLVDRDHAEISVRRQCELLAQIGRACIINPFPARRCGT